METEKELNEKETAQVMGGEADKFVECPESLTKPVKTLYSLHGNDMLHERKDERYNNRAGIYQCISDILF